jgi:CheY-like chemotaxis protein
MTAKAPDVDLTGHQILIVEDEIVVAIDLISIIRDAGAEVVGPAMSVREALRLIESHKITAAVIDVNLGKVDSLPVARRLDTAGIPFVFHTGNDDKLSPSPWPKAPIIKKPAVPAKLIAAVAAVAKKSRS